MAALCQARRMVEFPATGVLGFDLALGSRKIFHVPRIDLEGGGTKAKIPNDGLPTFLP